MIITEIDANARTVIFHVLFTYFMNPKDETTLKLDDELYVSKLDFTAVLRS